MQQDELEQAALLFDFLQLYRADREHGRVRELAHYTALFPGREELVAREYAALRRRAAEQPAAPAAAAELDGRGLAGYRILHELGQGGQGTVYLAEDLELGRPVAIKVLRSPLGKPSDARLARLRREVTLLARLDHPGILSVLRAQLEADPPFVVMRYVKGPTLGEMLAGAAPDGRPAALRCVPRQVAELERLLLFFEEAARALHAAHEAGVIHRDIKPHNIIASGSPDGSGPDRPVLLDFGLARTLDPTDASVTRTGELFGTPAYMSPEQFELAGEALDRRTDVHSLGATLFECLTGRKPFEAPSQQRLEQAIRLEPVPRASRLNPVLPPDLDVVLSTAMEKDRARRYATALDLAEELRRVREHRPVLARPTSFGLRARRWTQRNPVLATTVSLLSLGATALSIALLLLARESERTRAALRVAESRNLAADALTTLALDPLVALDRALAAHELAPGFHSRSALYAALIEQRIEHVLPQVDSHLTALSADRRWLAVARSDGTLLRYSLPDGEALRAGELAGASALDLSADGGRLAAGGADGTLVLLEAGAEARRLAPHASAVCALAFSPDAAQLASGDDSGLVRLHDLAGTRAPLEIATGGGQVGGLRFARDGSWLVSWVGEKGRPLEATDYALRLWSTADGAPVAELAGHGKRIDEVRFAPDGTRLATCSDDRMAFVWALPSGERLLSIAHPDKVHDVAFSPDGRRLATAFDPGEPGLSGASGAWVLDARSGERLVELIGHEARSVASVDWTPDGGRLLTASYDGTARIWDALTGSELSCLRMLSGLLFEARFLERGERMLVVHRNGEIVARCATRAGPLALGGHASAVACAAFDPGGKTLATADRDGIALLHDVHTGEILARLSSGEAPLTQVAFCRGGEEVLVGAADGRCLRFERGGALLGSIQVGTRPVGLLRVLADGESFVASAGAEAGLFDLAGASLLRLRHGGDVLCLDVSPDERLLATGADDRTVRVWDLASGRLVLERSDWNPANTLPSYRKVFEVRFDPSGRALLASCDDGFLREYDVETGELVLEKVALRFGRIHWLGPDRLLMMPKWNGGLCAFGAPFSPGEWQRLEPVPGGRCMAMDVSPDGSRVLVSSTDGRTLLWSLPDLEPWASVAGHGAAVTCAAFSPDGSCFVTAAADGSVRLWPTEPAAAARASRPR